MCSPKFENLINMVVCFENFQKLHWNHNYHTRIELNVNKTKKKKKKNNQNNRNILLTEVPGRKSGWRFTARTTIPKERSPAAQSHCANPSFLRVWLIFDQKFDIYQKICNCSFEDIYIRLRIRWVSLKTDRKIEVCYWGQLFSRWSKFDQKSFF